MFLRTYPAALVPLYDYHRLAVPKTTATFVSRMKYKSRKLLQSVTVFAKEANRLFGLVLLARDEGHTVEVATES